MDNVHDNTERPGVVTKKHCCLHGVTLLGVVKALSSSAIPVMIGIITLVIAIHQENVAQSNRDRDMAQAVELRKQDLELSRHQRKEDQESARLQRIEDIEISRLQRDLDLKIANDRRLQEKSIAERQHNLSEKLRTYEFQIARKNHNEDIDLEDDRQKESILLDYLDDFTSFFLDYSNKRGNISKTLFIAFQLKTGATLRRLDPVRRTILIQTFFEAGFFNDDYRGTEWLLFSANLSGANFGCSVYDNPNAGVIRYDNIRLESADITHSIFRKVLLVDSPKIDFSVFDYSYWSMVQFYNIRFEGHISMYGVTFSNSIIVSTVFGKNTNLDRVFFEPNTLCDHCQFIQSSLVSARLSHSNFVESKFISLSMADSNMSHGSFYLSTFNHVSLDRADMSGANLRSCVFDSVSMLDCLMFGANLRGANFFDANLTGCRGFDDSPLRANVVLYRTVLPNGTFVERRKLTGN